MQHAATPPLAGSAKTSSLRSNEYSTVIRALRPVGAPVPSFDGIQQVAPPDLSCGGMFAVRYVDSGTSALAQALTFARHRRGELPALLPAYGCPDLVAAAAYARTRVRLVDLEQDSPWISFANAETHVDRASAIVAVNFLGMRERLEELRELAIQARVPLIEDSAQMAPFSGGNKPTGDLVIFSFGRGKPVSVLGGGAVLIRRDWADEFDVVVPAPDSTVDSAAKFWLKRRLYNIAIKPRVFGVLRHLPALKLGEVAYEALSEIRAMDPRGRALLGAAHARSAVPHVSQHMLRERLRSVRSRVTDLPVLLGRDDAVLLRYPVLIDRPEHRAEVVARLDRAGLGPSTFYGKGLAEIAGLPPLEKGPAPNANCFASRLITLPIHEDVTPSDVDNMCAILGNRS